MKERWSEDLDSIVKQYTNDSQRTSHSGRKLEYGCSRILEAIFLFLRINWERLQRNPPKARRSAENKTRLSCNHQDNVTKDKEDHTDETKWEYFKAEEESK